jgi:hypothetical protein
MRRCNFLRLIYNKVTSRSYSYFLKVSYFEKLILPPMSKTAKFGKKTQRILAVNTPWPNMWIQLFPGTAHIKKH